MMMNTSDAEISQDMHTARSSLDERPQIEQFTMQSSRLQTEVQHTHDVDVEEHSAD